MTCTSASDEPTRALISLRKGQLYAAQGQTEQANAAYLDAVTNYPKTYDAYLALTELIAAGVPVDELLRGIIDYYANQYGVALSAFDRYLQNNPTDPASAYYYYGLTYRALGGLKNHQQWDKLSEIITIIGMRPGKSLHSGHS
jgi:soluble lytic murein transglycosylase